MIVGVNVDSGGVVGLITFSVVGTGIAPFSVPEILLSEFSDRLRKILYIENPPIPRSVTSAINNRNFIKMLLPFLELYSSFMK